MVKGRSVGAGVKTTASAAIASRIANLLFSFFLSLSSICLILVVYIFVSYYLNEIRGALLAQLL